MPSMLDEQLAILDVLPTEIVEKVASNGRQLAVAKGDDALQEATSQPESTRNLGLDRSSASGAYKEARIAGAPSAHCPSSMSSRRSAAMQVHCAFVGRGLEPLLSACISFLQTSCHRLIFPSELDHQLHAYWLVVQELHNGHG